MNRIILLLFVAVLLSPGVCLAAKVPDYDIKAYCKELAALGGGSYALEASCRELEADAKADIEKMNVPVKIMSYCVDFAKMGGSSYSLLLGCIELEMEAKSSLDE